MKNLGCLLLFIAVLVAGYMIDKIKKKEAKNKARQEKKKINLLKDPFEGKLKKTEEEHSSDDEEFESTGSPSMDKFIKYMRQKIYRPGEWVYVAREKAWACTDAQHWKKLIHLALFNDSKIFARAVIKGMLKGCCFLMNKGDAAVVEVQKGPAIRLTVKHNGQYITAYSITHYFTGVQPEK